MQNKFTYTNDSEKGNNSDPLFTKKRLYVLIIEDNEDDALLIVNELEKGGYQVNFKQVDSQDTMKIALDEMKWDIILSDFNIPGFNAFASLELLKSTKLDLPFIVITGCVGEETAVKLMREGAKDFILKNNLNRLIPVIERETHELQNRSAKNKAEIDLTEQRHQNENLEKLQEELRLSYEELKNQMEFNIVALNSILAHLVILDYDGTIVRVNDAWNKFAAENGADPKNVGIGTNYFEVCRSAIGAFADIASESMKGIQNVMDGTLDKFSMTYRCDSPDEVRWFLLIAFPFLTQKGKVLVKHIDITEQKMLEEKLLQSQKLDAVGMLAAGIAHDFNNLLTVIMGSANLATIKLQQGKEINNDLEHIIEASQRAANLTHQLLVFARKQVTSPTVIELNSLIVNLNKMLQRLIGENLEFITVLTPEKCMIKVDPVQMEQVIVNLVINACDAMNKKGKLFMETSVITLQNSIGKPEEFVVLEVRDTGSGMTEYVKAHIFEPFFTTKGVGKGTGLGLATCYGIITQCGGNIGIESTPGMGTSIKINLPKIKGEGDSFNYPSDIGGFYRGTQRILLVEDEQLVLNILSNTLKIHGYKVLESINGKEALKVFKESAENIDLVLTDIVMPEMPGNELVKKIREKNPEIKVIFMSGYTEDHETHIGLDENTAFIHKPFLPDVLLRKIKNFFPEP